MISFSDDGDEVVFVHVNGELVGQIDHETYGWSGMTEAMALVEAIAKRLNITIDNTQDIV